VPKGTRLAARNVVLSILSCVLVWLAPAGATAAVTANFREELNFFPPFCDNARVLQALGRTVGAGPELGEADEISNLCDYQDSITVDYNATTHRIILTPSGSNDYQTITITITNIKGQTITGLVPISDNLIDVGNSGAFTRSIDFSPNSITISYVIDDPSNSDNKLFFSTGSAIFQVDATGTAAAIPVLSPAGLGALLLLMLGLGLAAMRRGTHVKG
jgi:hypothetical protein